MPCAPPATSPAEAPGPMPSTARVDPSRAPPHGWRLRLQEARRLMLGEHSMRQARASAWATRMRRTSTANTTACLAYRPSAMWHGCAKLPAHPRSNSRPVVEFLGERHEKYRNAVDSTQLLVTHIMEHQSHTYRESGVPIAAPARANEATNSLIVHLTCNRSDDSTYV